MKCFLQSDRFEDFVIINKIEIHRVETSQSGSVGGGLHMVRSQLYSSGNGIAGPLLNY